MDIWVSIGYWIILAMFVACCYYSQRFSVKSTHKLKHFYFFLFWLSASAFICVLVNLWPVIYTEYRLNHLNAGISSEPAAWLDSVADENREEAKRLYKSNLGVDWSIPTILHFLFIGLPWSIVVSLISKWYSQKKSLV